VKYLLDADSTIDHLYDVIDLFTDIPNLAPHDLALSALSLIELYTGVYSSANPRVADRNLRHLLRSVALIPLNRRVIHASARLRAELIAGKRPIRHRAYDLIVAATAREYGLTVVTSHTRDYADIPGLQLVNPRRA
jgi:predicted nucleic acid-binding protein